MKKVYRRNISGNLKYKVILNTYNNLKILNYPIRQFIEEKVREILKRKGAVLYSMQMEEDKVIIELGDIENIVEFSSIMFRELSGELLKNFTFLARICYRVWGHADLYTMEE